MSAPPSSRVSPTDSPTDSAVPASPAARRHAARTWRDPRLAIGIALVAVSVLLGAKLLGDAGDTVRVWAAGHDLGAGSALSAGDLVPREVRFTGSEDANRYVSADSPIPPGTALTRDVGAGEMLPRAAIGDAATASLVRVPVSTAAESIPATVDTGSVVDIWITPQTDDGRSAGAAVQAFDDVTVVATPESGSALGPTASRQIIIGLPEEKQEDLAAYLAQAVSGEIVVTQQG